MPTHPSENENCAKHLFHVLYRIVNDVLAKKKKKKCFRDLKILNSRSKCKSLSVPRSASDCFIPIQTDGFISFNPIANSCFSNAAAVSVTTRDRDEDVLSHFITHCRQTNWVSTLHLQTASNSLHLSLSLSLAPPRSASTPPFSVEMSGRELVCRH